MNKVKRLALEKQTAKQVGIGFKSQLCLFITSISLGKCKAIATYSKSVLACHSWPFSYLIYCYSSK